MSLGNHEFDDGVEGLEPFLRLTYSQEQSFKYFYLLHCLLKTILIFEICWFKNKKLKLIIVIVWDSFVIVWDNFVIVWDNFVKVWDNFVIVWDNFVIVWDNFVIVWDNFVMVWDNFENKKS